jgi:hypothetical protein
MSRSRIRTTMRKRCSTQGQPIIGYGVRLPEPVVGSLAVTRWWDNTGRSAIFRSSVVRKAG